MIQSRCLPHRLSVVSPLHARQLAWSSGWSRSWQALEQEGSLKLLLKMPTVSGKKKTVKELSLEVENMEKTINNEIVSSLPASHWWPALSMGIWWRCRGVGPSLCSWLPILVLMITTKKVMVMMMIEVSTKVNDEQLDQYLYGKVFIQGNDCHILQYIVVCFSPCIAWRGRWCHSLGCQPWSTPLWKPRDGWSSQCHLGGLGKF